MRETTQTTGYDIEQQVLRDLERPSPVRAIIRDNTQYGYIVVLCPIGHLIEAHKIDRSYAGSMFEAELAWHSTGPNAPPDRFDRLAAKCQGAGHEQVQS
jgi:hypothetical protein